MVKRATIHKNTTTYIDFDGIAKGTYLLAVSNTYRASILYIVIVGADASPKVSVSGLRENSYYTVSVTDNTKVAIKSADVISDVVVTQIA